MSSKTKIVVLHMKEVIYTAIFLILAAVTIALIFVMFGGKDKQKDNTNQAATEAALYTPGVYTASITLSDQTFDVQVTVDTSHINAIELINLSETATVMYPLMEPTLQDIASQIYLTQTTDNITYTDNNKYTSKLLVEAIKTALQKAIK